MVVTGQTQEAGKTTTLEGLIQRSGLRAVAFITKRGEGSFEHASAVRPYFREQADWQFVASILEASRGEKLRFERAWIIRASKGAQTLREVQINVRRLMAKAKGMSADVYLTLDAYLDVVVPQIGAIDWAPRLDLAAGVNVMDLSEMPVEMQHLVIKSSLDYVLRHERETVVVIPEAWKYIPQGRGTPVKLAAEAYIRQAAALGNYLWLDSQDIGGIDKAILRSVPVWLLGVQRETNEIKRTLANIPVGIGKPKAEAIAHLSIGQFVAAWGKHIVPTYVWPSWLDESTAADVAAGGTVIGPPVRKEAQMAVSQREADLERHNFDLRSDLAKARLQIEELQRKVSALVPTPSSNHKAPGRSRSQDASSEGQHETAPSGRNAGWTPAGDEDALYQRFKTRLASEAPQLLAIAATRPGIEVTVTVERIAVDGRSLRGRIARLIADGFFEKARTSTDVTEALVRAGWDRSPIALNTELRELTELGFFTRDNKWISLVPGMEVNVIER